MNSITTPNDKPASRGEQTAQTVRKVGDVVYTALVAFNSDGTVKAACTQKRIVCDVNPNFLKKGLAYGCRLPQHAHIDGAGMSYRPENLFDTRAEAHALVRRRLARALESVTIAVKNSI